MTLLSPGSSLELARTARSGLRRHHDVSAEVVARAPGRVNLMGEHTDYNGGLVLPVALDHATYAAAAGRDDDRIRLSSDQADGLLDAPVSAFAPGAPDAAGWGGYTGGVLWALREAGVPVGGMDLHLCSTVPTGAGLSSSAAVECAVGLAALLLARHPVDEAARRTLIAAAVRAEQEVAGAPTGGMDQTVSMLARPGHALLIDFAGAPEVPVPLALEEAGRTLLVTDTRVHHQLIDGAYGSRRDECRAAAEALGTASLREATAADVDTLRDPVLRRRARHIVTEIVRVPAVVAALEEHDWSRLGDLFAASHLSMRDDFEISAPELDLAVTTARAAGAEAARMTGGGFGGSIVSLVPDDRVETVLAALDAAFASAGYAPPAHLRVGAAGGAAQVS